MPTVSSVSVSASHTFSKLTQAQIELVAGLGVAGDAHMGATVKHRSRVARDPSQPNLRQVHCIHAELFDQLVVHGFQVLPGQMGENITTVGIDLLSLPTGTRLSIGPDAVIEITGLRNPCVQIDQFQPGLLAAVLDRDAAGNLIRKAGVMSIVRVGGIVRPGDSIAIEYPAEPWQPLQVV
ncbi:MAG: MOSC domain-containing protein [Roseiflexaceae bacterium]